MTALKEEIISLIKQENKIEAIKLICEAYQLGLKEAKEYYEKVETDVLNDVVPPAPAEPLEKDGQQMSDLAQEVIELIERKQKLQAIKLIHETTQMGLKESKAYCEKIENELLSKTTQPQQGENISRSDTNSANSSSLIWMLLLLAIVVSLLGYLFVL